MGTREVYEEKLRSGNLHHDPTMNPGLGSPRCPRCLSLLDHDSVLTHKSITQIFCSKLTFCVFLLFRTRVNGLSLLFFMTPLLLLARVLVECLVQFMASIQGYRTFRIA